MADTKEPTAEMLNNLDLLLNYRFLDAEKDWAAIESMGEIPKHAEALKQRIDADKQKQDATDEN